MVMCSDKGPSSAGCGQADADIPQFSPHRADIGLFAGLVFVHTLWFCSNMVNMFVSLS